MRRRGTLLTTLLALAVTGCGAQAAPTSATTPRTLGLSTEGAWIRTTDGASNPSMTALFLTVVNPTAKPVRLVSAACADAGRTEVHEMVAKDGKMVMQEAKGGVEVAAGQHLHLKPGGAHVMLMQLNKPLPVGEQSSCSLTFDEGTTLQVNALVKVFTEEEDHYHDGQSPSPSSGISGTRQPTMVKPTQSASDR